MNHPTFIRIIFLLTVGAAIWVKLAQPEWKADAVFDSVEPAGSTVTLHEASGTAITAAQTVTAHSIFHADDPAPPTVFGFDALTAGRVPVRKEARQFQAQKWEPDLVKALSLPKNTPLQRRTAIYHIPELKFPLVRVDRIYRMDRGWVKNGPSVASAVKSEIHSSLKFDPKITPAQREALTKPADAPAPAEGGELLWDNAMIADHLMVQTQLHISRDQLQRVLPAQVRIQSAVNAEKGLYLVSIPHENERSLELAVLALNHESFKKIIWFAEPDFLMAGADTTADDPLFTTSTTDTTKQWALPKIMAPRAWDVIKQPVAVGGVPATTIANTTVVAIVDTGVDYTHPDLTANIYANPGESGDGKETNGIDDDGNGKIDDYRGWNFVENNNNPMDDVGHGTHVAGIIGAVGNNATGATGVCWGVKMLPLRIIKKLGLGAYGVYSDAVAAMDYMRTLNSPTKRVAVANHSWGGSGYSLAMLNAVNNPLLSADPLPDGLRGTYDFDANTITLTGTTTELAKVRIGMEFAGIGIPEDTVITILSGTPASGLSLTLSDYSREKVTNQPVCFANPIRPKPYGIVHVAAAGNSRFNADRIPTYPASLPSGFMMSVGASDVNDAPAVWSGAAGSNYGRLNVDIFAPGSSIWSMKLKAPADPAYGYESRNGTSMAAPFVAGSVALLKMWQPRLTDLQTRQIIIDNTDVIAGLKDKCLGGGRLNLAKLVDKLYQPMLVGSGGSTGGGGSSIELLNDAMSVTQRIAFGGAHSSGHALFVDRGEVWSWGKGNSGQLGRGGDDAKPSKITGLNEITMVGARGGASLALKANGTVWVWGSKSDGFFGDGSTSGSEQIPQLVPSLTDVVWISQPEASFSTAVNTLGKVFSWGRNQYNRLGYNSANGTLHTPQEVPGVDGVIQISCGSYHAVALRNDGMVWGWGSRSYVAGNALGDGTGQPDLASPFLIPGLTNVRFVAAAGSYSLFLMQDGTVRMAGAFNDSWPARNDSHTQVVGLERIRFISAGEQHALALDEDGNLFVWGDGEDGALATGNETTQTTPVQVGVSASMAIVTCRAGSRVSGIVDAEGRIWCSGNNRSGALGLGLFPQKQIPTRNEALHGVVEIGGASSGFCTWARKSDGSFIHWGPWNYNTFGDGSLKHAAPVEFKLTGKTVVEMVGNPSVQKSNWFARTSDGLVYAWGPNNDLSPELGTFSGTPQPSPVQIPTLSNIIKIATGDIHSLALRSDGRIFSWGNNGSGAIGDGTSISRAIPVLLSAPVGVKDVICTSQNSFALCHDGSVWVWGANSNGQIGDGSQVPSYSPKLISAVTDIVQFLADPVGRCFALKTDGSIFTWGAGGQLTPTLLVAPSLPQIQKISILTSTTLVALRSDSTLVSWSFIGSYVSGQHPGLASGGPVFGGIDVEDIHAGHFRKADGSVWCWGQGYLGFRDEWKSVFQEPLEIFNQANALSSLGAGDLADSWFFQNFSISDIVMTSISGDQADPDKDGVSNLLEYALGLNPLTQDRSGLPMGRVDYISSHSASEGDDGQVQLFSANDCCISVPVGLDAGKRYMAFTVERRGGIRTDIDYIIEVSNDLVNWRSSQADVLTVINTGELLEAYSTTPIEAQPAQFMRLKIRRK